MMNKCVYYDIFTKRTLSNSNMNGLEYTIFICCKYLNGYSKSYAPDLATTAEFSEI